MSNHTRVYTIDGGCQFQVGNNSVMNNFVGGYSGPPMFGQHKQFVESTGPDPRGPLGPSTHSPDTGNTRVVNCGQYNASSKKGPKKDGRVVNCRQYNEGDSDDDNSYDSDDYYDGSVHTAVYTDHSVNIGGFTNTGILCVGGQGNVATVVNHKKGSGNTTTGITMIGGRGNVATVVDHSTHVPTRSSNTSQQSQQSPGRNKYNFTGNSIPLNLVRPPEDQIVYGPAAKNCTYTFEPQPGVFYGWD